MTTEKQKNAVQFCEEVLGVDFAGDINSYEEVSKYLSLYLNLAKSTAREMDNVHDHWAIVHGYI